MKLVYLSGEQKGGEIDIPPLGVSLGREDDNDVILTDAKASRYHARIVSSDGIWHVHDLDSMNGVELNGTKVRKSAPLSIQDEIRIGKTRLMFCDAAGVPPAAVADSAAGPREEPRRDTTAPADAARRRHGRLLALGLGLLIAVVAVEAVLLLGGGNQQASGVPPAPAPATLRVFYEKLEASAGAVFRYELSIEDGRLRVTVDDLKNGRHVAEARELTREQLADLGKTLLTPEFLALRSAAARDSRQRLDRTRLTVQVGRRGNAVDIVNELHPSALTAVISVLEELAEDTFGFVAVPLSREAIMTKVRERFEFAERAFAEREVEAANLYRAYEAYCYVVEYLNGYDDKPAFYQQAFERQQKSRAMLTKQLKNHEFSARLHLKLGELDAAREELQRILDKIPDPADTYVQTARKLLHEISRRQDQLKRNKRSR